MNFPRVGWAGVLFGKDNLLQTLEVQSRTIVYKCQHAQEMKLALMKCHKLS